MERCFHDFENKTSEGVDVQRKFYVFDDKVFFI